MESFCERINEPSDSIKCWETVEWLYNWLASRVTLSSTAFDTYLWGSNGAQSTITAALYWPVVPTLNGMNE
jgi:hypothetical protein